MLDIFNNYLQSNGIIDLDMITGLEKVNKKTYGSMAKQ